MAQVGDQAQAGGRPSRCELTLAGKVTVTFLVIGFSVALLHGSNPVLFVVSCLVATVLLSMLLTFLSTARLSLRRFMPERVLAGTRFDIRLEVRNRSRWRPAFGLRFQDTLQIARAGESMDGPELRVLPPKGRAEVTYRKRMHRRGIYTVTRCVAATRFPFALFERRVLLRSRPARLVVMPSLGRLEKAGAEALVERASRCRQLDRSVEGSEQFHGLREYRPGDNPRFVHWKTTARMGKLMRRVMQDESSEELTVLLDTQVAGLAAEQRARSLEKAVSCAATLLADAARRGRKAAVYFHGGCARHHGSMQAVLPALEALAGIVGQGGGSASLVESVPVRGASLLLLSLQGPASAARRAAVARGLALRVWDVSRPDFERVFTKR